MNGFPLNGGIGAEKQAQRLGIKAAVGVIESLIEVVDAEQDLVAQARSKQ